MSYVNRKNNVKEPLISIIVPVYNTSDYLEKCLDSLINQTYRNIEIVVVNDGSTDNSDEILNKYSRNFKNIKYICKENGGLSTARNCGIDNSSGDFLGFVDSDDWVDLDMYERLLSAILEDDSDISICGIRYTDSLGNEIDIVPGIKSRTCITSNDALCRLFIGEEYKSHAVDKLYRADLFRGIRYPAQKQFEDVFTTYLLLLSSGKVSLIPRGMYNYLIERPGSILSKPFNERFFDQLDAVLSMESVLKRESPVLKESFYFEYLKLWTILDVANYITASYLITNKKSFYIKTFLHKCKTLTCESRQWIKNRYLSKRERIKLILIFYVPRLYFFSYSTYIKKRYG